MKTLNYIFTLLFIITLFTISFTFTNEYQSGFAITMSFLLYVTWEAYYFEKKEKAMSN